ncbi:hypothetical protein CQA44_09405 [Helicobacter sp. MIT 14-3879]|nr:hypothetical protein CQA44_09405 [Helicobacter sp. MIT 14-3879]
MSIYGGGDTPHSLEAQICDSNSLCHSKPLGEESPCHSKQSEVSLKDSKNISCHSEPLSPCHSEVLQSKAEESHNVESKRDVSGFSSPQQDKVISNQAQRILDSNAEAVEMRNCGFQTRGERSLVSLNDQAKSVESAIYRSKQDEVAVSLANAESDLILDFFAGSGTTAQAVMELNAEDGGNRKFILVQIDEEIKEDKSKIAYDFCKNELHSSKPCISDITIERVKRAGAKIAKEHKDFKGDLGFNVYSLCDKPSLTCDKEGHLELLVGREGASPSDIARNLALQCGKTLDRELECIMESKLYKCEDVYCVVECDKEVLEFLSHTKNEYIFIDGYANIGLEEFLNLKNSANIDERLRIVY